MLGWGVVVVVWRVVEWIRCLPLQRRVLLHAISAIRSRELSKGWGSWREMLRARHVMRRAALAISARSQRLAVSSWVTYCKEASCALLSSRRAVESWRSAGVRQAYNSMKEVARTVRAMRRVAAAVIHAKKRQVMRPSEDEWSEE